MPGKAQGRIQLDVRLLEACYHPVLGLVLTYRSEGILDTETSRKRHVQVMNVAQPCAPEDMFLTLIRLQRRHGTDVAHGEN